MSTFEQNGHTADCTRHMDVQRAIWDDWRRTWPNACKTCHARGTTHSPATRIDPEETNVCDDCLGQDVCPRCRAFHLPNPSKRLTAISTSLEETPFTCYACGWTGERANDTEPPPPECECWRLREEQYPILYAATWQEEG